MPRIMIKGGVWRNTEDEILKVAVSKYGLNQWSRVASLLHRKSAKQCKARWNEWLDPSIKKTEWSREEEEKLLHLAKILPTQWRTIASSIGRTASQCLEHYEYLLDQAQKKEEGDDAVPSMADDPRRLRPGEIDPNPETKPARPDPQDMDQDELEMLSEARARLANTQGKKAKRKAREKQLEEARRLAALGKARELRMAGIGVSLFPKKKKYGIDYNAEIPFEKPVPSGLYNTSQEAYNPKDFDFKRLRQEHMDGELRSEKEEELRKRDKQKSKERKESGIPQVQLSDKFLDPMKPKRAPLIFPAPQISEYEIEQVIKLGRASEAAIDAVRNNNSSGTDGLLSDYSLATSAAMQTVTPMSTRLSRDSILREASNLAALSSEETPLAGGTNAVLHDTPFTNKGMTESSRTIAVTPNTFLATPFRVPKAPSNNETVSESQRSSSSLMPPPRTPALSERSISSTVTTAVAPVRDRLLINNEENLFFEDSSRAKQYMEEAKQEIRNLLESLPQPQNEYMLNDEYTEPEPEEEVNDDEAGAMVPDEAHLDELRRKAEEKARLDEFRRKSRSVQLGLPRPLSSSLPLEVSDNYFPNVPSLVRKEILTMMHHDALHEKSEEQQIEAAQKLRSGVDLDNLHAEFLTSNPYEIFSDDDLSSAKQLVQSEMESSKERFDEFMEDSLRKTRERYESFMNLITGNSRCNQKEGSMFMEHAKGLYESYKPIFCKEQKKISKSEAKLKVILGGYQAKTKSLIDQIIEVIEKINQSDIELHTIKKIQTDETLAGQRRVNKLNVEIQDLKTRENLLQDNIRQIMADK